MSSSTDQYTQLASFTTLVIDSGDLDSIRRFVPTDATTNPSLLLAACSDPKYEPYVADVSGKLRDSGREAREETTGCCTRVRQSRRSLSLSDL